MAGIFEGLGVMAMLVVVVMIAVAMAIDCVSGWRKAKLRGDEHSSYAFSRSFTKFLIYEGIVVIGGLMDMLLHFAWLQFMDGVYMVPVVCILFGIVLCIVEAWSVKEKADQKQRKRMDEAAELLAKVLDKETVKELLRPHVKAKAEAAEVAVMPSTELNEDNF